MNIGMKLCGLLLGLALLAGCAGQTMRIDPIPDTANLDRAHGRHITAKASGFQLFTALPTTASYRHERAWQALRDQAPGEAIADVSIRESWYYAVLGPVYTTTVEAIAYPIRQR